MFFEDSYVNVKKFKKSNMEKLKMSNMENKMKKIYKNVYLLTKFSLLKSFLLFVVDKNDLL
jgi:hypothetical protein